MWGEESEDLNDLIIDLTSIPDEMLALLKDETSVKLEQTTNQQTSHDDERTVTTTTGKETKKKNDWINHRDNCGV